MILPPSRRMRSLLLQPLSSSLTNNFFSSCYCFISPTGIIYVGDVTLSYGAVLVGVGAVLTQKLGAQTYW